MKIRDKIKEDAGFQFMMEDLQLLSSVGRRRLMEQPWLTDAAAVTAELDNVQRLLPLLHDEACARPLADFRHRLMELQDIHGTIAGLRQRSTLTEVELFQVKSFAFICLNANVSADALGVKDLLRIPDLSEIFELLDPDHTRIANFYIYDTYHPELGPLRKALKVAQAKIDARQQTIESEELQALNEQISILFSKQEELQQQVILRLSEQLWPCAAQIGEALERMAYADLLMAKALQVEAWGLCRPVLTENEMELRQVFNPRLRKRNEELKLRYQPVDIAMGEGVTLITGANMAGKTVLLKTVAIAQMMAQFGFYVPAEAARMPLLGDVAVCIGDEQDEMNGLSSFASEIIKISNTLQRTVSQRLLVLIDEPARTTNPVEGKAIIQAIGELLQRRDSFSMITTHYSQLGLECQRLRVRGFVESLADRQLTPDNINQFMDYSLMEDASDEVPQEALRIASILSCDAEMIALAQKKLLSNM